LHRKSTANTRLTPQTRPKHITKAFRFAINTKYTSFCAENVWQTRRKHVGFAPKKHHQHPFKAANTSERHYKSARFASQKRAQTHSMPQKYPKDAWFCAENVPQTRRKHVLHRKRVANTSVLRRKSAANTRLTPQRRLNDIIKAPVLHRKSAQKHTLYHKYIRNTPRYAPKMHRKHILHRKRVANTSISRRKSTVNTRLTPQTRPKDITKASRYVLQKRPQTHFIPQIHAK